MRKLEILKRIGKAGLNLAGLQAGAGKDKVRALEAEKELLELKVALARQALGDIHAIVEPLEVAEGTSYDQIRREAAEALLVLGSAE